MWAIAATIVRRVFQRRPPGHDDERREAQAASLSWPVPRMLRTPQSRGVNWAAIDAREGVGADGELRVRELLLERLPAGMLILNNLELPELRGDIDLLIVGSTGLFVAEVKAWSGAIRCSLDGRRWSRITAGGERQALPDPAAQVRREIGALRAFLQHADPELCRRTELWIDGFLVFAHPRARVDARCSRVPALSPDAAVARVRETIPRVRLSPADLDRIVALIESVQLTGLVRETQAGGRVVVHH